MLKSIDINQREKKLIRVEITILEMGKNNSYYNVYRKNANKSRGSY